MNRNCRMDSVELQPSRGGGAFVSIESSKFVYPVHPVERSAFNLTIGIVANHLYCGVQTASSGVANFRSGPALRTSIFVPLSW